MVVEVVVVEVVELVVEVVGVVVEVVVVVEAWINFINDPQNLFGPDFRIVNLDKILFSLHGLVVRLLVAISKWNSISVIYI